MRILFKASIPTESGNAGIANGKLPTVIRSFVETHKPESVVFGVEGGMRTMWAVLDMKTNDDMPSIGEPFFLELGAQLSVSPVMSFADLGAGLAKLPK